MDEISMELKRLDPADAIIELMKMVAEAEPDNRAFMLEFTLTMAWNGGIADGRHAPFPPG